MRSIATVSVVTFLFLLIGFAPVTDANQDQGISIVQLAETQDDALLSAIQQNALNKNFVVCQDLAPPREIELSEFTLINPQHQKQKISIHDRYEYKPYLYESKPYLYRCCNDLQRT